MSDASTRPMIAASRIAEAHMPEIQLSQMDSERFGVAVARGGYVSAESISLADQYCLQRHVDLLIVRCPTTSTRDLNALEIDGFRVMDTLVYWRHRVDANPRGGPAREERPFRLRRLGPADGESVVSIAEQAFRHYSGHYHADPRLSAEASTQAYVSWAARCCGTAGVVDQMIGAERDGAVVGFLALAHPARSASDIVLTAVSPQAQGMGILRAMIGRAVDEVRLRGRGELEYSCVITNIAAQKALARQGFWIDRSYHTLHKWYT